MDLILWVVIGAIAVIIAFLILAYNGFISKRMRVNNAWAQIDVQLKKRFDLVPNLVETVKGYAKHERVVFENVTKARAQMMGAGSLADKAKASDALSRTLKTLFAVAENYPQLKANENFRVLQEQLDGIESKIAYARQFYNDSVMDYNTALQVFPGNVFASMFGFKEKEFFEVKGGAEREAVKVEF